MRFLLPAASVHASLASLVYSVGSGLEGSRILVNSYGSGLAASLFCIQARPVTGRFSVASIAHKVPYTPNPNPQIANPSCM